MTVTVIPRANPVAVTVTEPTITLEFSTLVGICSLVGTLERPGINFDNWAATLNVTVPASQVPAAVGLDNLLTEASDTLTTEASDQLTTES